MNGDKHSTYLLLLIFFLALMIPPAQAEPGEIRVGVVAFSGLESAQALGGRIQTLFRESRPDSHVKLAVGSYGDLQNWIEHSLIDLAVVTPGVASEVERRISQVPSLSEWDYLASVTEARHSASVCVVPTDSPIQSASEFKARVENAEVDFLFVDSYSVSGFLAPLHALKSVGVPIPKLRVNFSASHQNSLRLLESRSKSGGAPSVACVWNGELNSYPNQAAFRVLPFPALESQAVPRGLVFVKKSLKTPELLRSIEISEIVTVDSSWKSEVQSARTLLDEFTGKNSLRDPKRITLDEFGNLILHHVKNFPTPLRLAVVFSGGGAKCAFQAGAIRALEEKLIELRTALSDPGLDIGLVVGTSGGAINALAVAMGASSDAETFKAFASLWRELDQRTIIRPSFRVRANMMLWFLACQFFCFFVIDTVTGRRRTVLFIAAIFGLLQSLFALGFYSPDFFLGNDSGRQKLWLWAGWGMEGAGPVLFVVAVAWLLAVSRKKSQTPEEVSEGWSRRRLIALCVCLTGVLGLPLVQAYTILFLEPTLSGSSGIERTVFEKFSRLSNLLLTSRGDSALQPIAEGDLRTKIQKLSEVILGKGLLKRDLVLTGSRLGVAATTLPGDLYFYARANRTSPAPRFNERGVDLGSHPNLLLDVMMGSGAIYPIFPAREIPSIMPGVEAVEIVDGSYSHRSPIDAAVAWGATHILLIEASPSELMKTGSFAANIAVSLNHLYDQAQILDMRSKEEVVTVTLYPAVPQIGLLDFSASFIQQALDKGYQETKSSTVPPFVKEPSAPKFFEVEDSSRG